MYFKSFFSERSSGKSSTPIVLTAFEKIRLLEMALEVSPLDPTEAYKKFVKLLTGEWGASGWWDRREFGVFGPYESRELAEEHRHGLGKPLGPVFYGSIRECSPPSDLNNSELRREE